MPNAEKINCLYELLPTEIPTTDLRDVEKQKLELAERRKIVEAFRLPTQHGSPYNHQEVAAYVALHPEKPPYEVLYAQIPDSAYDTNLTLALDLANRGIMHVGLAVSWEETCNKRRYRWYTIYADIAEQIFFERIETKPELKAMRAAATADVDHLLATSNINEELKRKIKAFALNKQAEHYLWQEQQDPNSLGEYRIYAAQAENENKAKKLLDDTPPLMPGDIASLIKNLVDQELKGFSFTKREQTTLDWHRQTRGWEKNSRSIPVK